MDKEIVLNLRNKGEDVICDFNSKNEVGDLNFLFSNGYNASISRDEAAILHGFIEEYLNSKPVVMA